MRGRYQSLSADDVYEDYLTAIAERDSARNVAVRLEQELAELRRQYGLDS